MPEHAILIVEDDPNDVILIQRAFQRARVANPLRFAGDGEQAIAYLRGEGDYGDRTAHPLPVLILLDLKLPRVSGFEVLAWLRAQPVLRRIPVAILTSSAESPDINRAYDLGANSYLVKPVLFAALVELVQTLKLYWLITNTGPEIGADPES